MWFSLLLWSHHAVLHDRTADLCLCPVLILHTLTSRVDWKFVSPLKWPPGVGPISSPVGVPSFYVGVKNCRCSKAPECVNGWINMPDSILSTRGGRMKKIWLLTEERWTVIKIKCVLSRNRVTDKENLWLPGDKRGRGLNWEIGTGINTLLYIK